MPVSLGGRSTADRGGHGSPLGREGADLVPGWNQGRRQRRAEANGRLWGLTWVAAEETMRRRRPSWRNRRSLQGGAGHHRAHARLGGGASQSSEMPPCGAGSGTEAGLSAEGPLLPE